jgi:hypothetical protein
VQITNLPSVGTLMNTDTSTAIAANDYVSYDDIDAGYIAFIPAANANGSGYASFTFQVQDDGGTDNGGVDQDSDRTMTIDVTSVNDAPAGADNTVATDEDTLYFFSASDFGFTDPNDSPADNFQAIRITTLPGSGALIDTSTNIAVDLGDYVAASQLAFVPVADENGTPYTTFTFQMQDDGGGNDQDGTDRTMTVNVNSVNDPPVQTGTFPSAFAVNEDSHNATPVPVPGDERVGLRAGRRRG